MTCNNIILWWILCWHSVILCLFFKISIGEDSIQSFIPPPLIPRMSVINIGSVFSLKSILGNRHGNGGVSFKAQKGKDGLRTFMKGRERKRKRERCGASEGNSTANGCQRTTRRRDTNIHYIIFPSLPILSFVPFVPLFPYCDCLSVCLSVCHYSSPFTLRTQLAVLL